MNHANTTLGNTFIITHALFFALFSIFSKLIGSEINIFLVMALAWAIAGVGFFVYMIIKKRNPWTLWKNSHNKFNIIAPAIIIGIVVHGLLFYGLQFTSAGNLSILAASEVLFSFLLFHFWKAEKEKTWHLLGAALMLVGIGIVFWDQLMSFSFNKGDIFLLLAFAIAPTGNLFQKKAMLNGEKSEFILLVRSIISAPFFAVIFFVTSSQLPSSEIFFNALPWILAIGLLPLGIAKILWVEGITRISIPKAASLNLVAPFATLVLAFFILDEIPSIYQLLALVPICAGVLLLVKK